MSEKSFDNGLHIPVLTCMFFRFCHHYEKKQAFLTKPPSPQSMITAATMAVCISMEQKHHPVP